MRICPTISHLRDHGTLLMFGTFWSEPEYGLQKNTHLIAFQVPQILLPGSLINSLSLLDSPRPIQWTTKTDKPLLSRPGRIMFCMLRKSFRDGGWNPMVFCSGPHLDSWAFTSDSPLNVIGLVMHACERRFFFFKLFSQFTDN